MSEVEETFSRIKTHKGVETIVITNFEGGCIKSNLPKEKEAQFSLIMSQLASKVKSAVKELDSGNDTVFIRIRTKKNEIMIAPDNEFNLVVIQNPDEQ